MKQLTKMGMLLAFGGLLASCSNDNIDNPGVEQNPTVSKDGNMYMTINVALPPTNGTRAVSGYEELIPNEYAVKDMTLYVFKMASTGESPEEDAEYLDVVEVGFAEPIVKDEENSDVTGSYEATFQITQDKWKLDAQAKPQTAGDTYWGLLVINKPESTSGWVEPSTIESKKYNKWNETVLNATSGSTAANIVMPNGYFTMTNAPIVGEDEESISVLVKIDTEKFATSPELATQSAADFYVQRVVSKVRIGGGNYKDEDTDLESVPVTQNDDDTVLIDAWALDITNLATYAVQNVDDFETWMGYTKHDYFTAGATGATEAITHFWWGRDPNYETAHGESVNSWANSFNYVTTAEGINLETDAYTYCLENTMDQSLQNTDQSTRVIFAAKYQPGGNPLNEETESGIMVFNDIAMVVKKADLATANYSTPGEVELSTLISSTATYIIKKDTYEVVEEEDGDNTTTISAQEYYRNSLKMANYTQKVTYYPNGRTYYTAIIRHFDDVEVPLTADQKKVISTDEFEYLDYQSGRYGILRNNVYEVLVAAVQGFGSPTVPETPDPGTPDDKEDPKKFNALININILNWAKRSSQYIPK